MTLLHRAALGRRRPDETRIRLDGRSAGDTMDVGAGDAKVLQFARGHAAEFCDGLAILYPVVEATCNAHDSPLSADVTLATSFDQSRRRFDDADIDLSSLPENE